MSAPPPPTPVHLLRSHTSPVSALAVSDDNERIYSADASGKVVVTSTRSLRAIASWSAHTDSILGLEEWDNHIITHSRDHKLHVWERVLEIPLSARLGGSAALPDLPTPKLLYSLDVNALNFCRFSLLKLDTGAEGDSRALLALPNLVDSSTVDVWSLPSLTRVHAAIGQEISKSIFSADPGGRNTSGIIMSLHLFQVAAQTTPSTSELKTPNLRLVCAYENGSVVLREYTREDKETSVEGAGWDMIWTTKLHVESIMAMRVSRLNDFALTISADHIVGRYDLGATSRSSETNGVAYRTKHAGNGSVTIRDDGKVCAIGGWDGKIRLYSTKSFKPLGTLKYHKTACQCIEFTRSLLNDENARHQDGLGEDDEDDGEMSMEEMVERSRWLIAGSKDNRVSIWSLMSFEKLP
ncbi:WD40-repeat-containing domain protein [Crassisporium funariophilum]|nr:WD40-repeat-containing domain protein [Crassisporium funariophilum]